LIRKIKPAADNLLTASKKQETSLNYFWYGFVIYQLFFVLAYTESSFLSAASCQGFQIIGFGLMGMGAAGLMTFKFDDKYLKQLFIINLLYSVTIILRGSTYDKDALKQMFLDVTFGILPYLTPLVMLLPRNIRNYKKIFNVLLIFGFFFMLSVLMFYNTLHDYDRLNLVSQGLVEILSVMLSLPIAFFLFNYFYHPEKKALLGLGLKNIFGIFVILVTLFFAIFRARRGLIFMCVSSMACFGMIYIINTKKKMLIIIMSAIMILGGAFYVINVKTPAMFNYLIDRADSDTRTGVEVYMYADMSPVDWVIGKGIKGQYYCPVVDNVNDASGQGYRETIETGYLQIILKGGIVSLALLLLMFLPAVYKGFFKSQNILSKAAAMWVFLWIVYLYPAGGIVFNFNYVLVWVATGICYSERIRNMSDNTIKTYLQN